MVPDQKDWKKPALRALSGILGTVTSNMFPNGIADILSAIFNLTDNSDFMQYFQEIIDTVDIGVRTIIDECPDFKPLSSERNIPCKMINSTGLRELERFLDKHESSDHFGGLVQCVEDETMHELLLKSQSTISKQNLNYNISIVLNSNYGLMEQD
ncbi:hypothetical protein C1645_831146 [Glomus cerebriforme]|uniref:Uncharacterized protein n=1 Tax=Glomus cerebriforme TaxID=658196 RepID=A0A397SMK3_9GLOM|nr:hypothetical protein C1645_831146 [Glomus cerebriforme]